MQSKIKKTPMQEQWEQAKAAHPETVLFFRMGDFYEMFGEDAVKCSRILGLTLTTRDRNKENALPMAGIPHHALDRYLKEMMNAGERVAICEQLENPATATGIVKRGVLRVITPGTVLDDSCLSAKKNNFLASLAVINETLSIAAIDISTGEFFVQNVNDAAEELQRLQPAEILAPREILGEGKSLSWLPAHAAQNHWVLTKRDGYEFTAAHGELQLCQHFGVHNLDGFGISEMPAAIAAAGAILTYVTETQKTTLTHLQTLRLLHRGDFLWLDYATQRNLEILYSASGGYSLLNALDRTVTAAGGRLLKNWLRQPLRRVEAIQYRQVAVAELLRDAPQRDKLRRSLEKISDLARLLSRLATGRATPRDVYALGVSAAHLPEIIALLAPLSAAFFRDLTLDALSEVSALIARALNENPPTSIADGGFIKSEFNQELAELRALANGGKDWIKECERAEQARSGISSLKIGFNRVFGYYLEITNTHKDKIPANYERKQTLANAERYITPQLKQYEAQVLGAEEKSKILETQIFAQVCGELLQFAARIQTTANALAMLDVMTSLAEVSATEKYCLPEITATIETEIIDGKHPVLAARVHNFTPNDTHFSPAERLHIITGPNMAGKSTYIRQVALLTIMAQIGCGIPARSARIGLADRIFTRVGAADDLARGQSTFMVEMAETANILHNATAQSLIILDEVGRGTSTFDGVSLAWAITEYVHNVLQARTLFATHYHELAELGNLLPHAKNYNVLVREWSDQVIFLHKIAAGAADKSYGIQVARLAGLPPSVLARAKEMLFSLESSAELRDETLAATPTAKNAPTAKSARRKTLVQAKLF